MKQTNSRTGAADRRVRRLKAKYRKRMLLVGVIFFIIGIVAGALVHGWYTGRRDEPVAIAPTSAPTVEPEGFDPFEQDDGEFGFDGIDDDDFELDPTGGFAVDEDIETADEPAGTEAAEPEATEAARPVIQVPAAEETETEETAVSALPVLDDAGEAEAQTDSELPRIEPEAAAVEPAEEATPAPDMSSDMVEEYDPAEGEVPVEYTMEQEELANPQPAAAAEPEAAVEAAEAQPGTPQVIAVVPYGESYSYTTQVNLDGTARLEAADEPYETLRFTQTMQEYLRPSDFANRYATEYRLTGDEAGAGFELVLNDYVGSSTIIPQNVMDVGFCSATGNTVERGYQLMDAAIGGNYEVAVESETPKTLFKRYAYSNLGEEMEYLVVTTYNNGVEQMILFELESDEPQEPEIIYPMMQKGLKNDDVKALQERLIELGYLSGKADGDFGPATEKAVIAAQEAYGLEANGIADNELQHKLFDGVEPAASDEETAEE